MGRRGPDWETLLCRVAVSLQHMADSQAAQDGRPSHYRTYARNEQFRDTNLPNWKSLKQTEHTYKVGEGFKPTALWVREYPTIILTGLEH